MVLELLALTAVGFVVARVGLQERHDLVALAQGMVIGPALWGLGVNFILYLMPGLAGAIAGWVLVLALGGVLAWRSRADLSIPIRRLVGFAATVLVVLWMMLAARQLMKIPDPEIHLGLAAYVRAGGWPPTTPWNPDLRFYYHHGVDLLIGLLAPNAGSNEVLVTEFISAYIWTAFALTIALALLVRGGWIGMVTVSPLLLTAGSWTLLGYLNRVPNIIQIPLPTEIHTPGLMASLSSLYWPDELLRWHSEIDGVPANIWKPQFVLAYALAFIILSHAAVGDTRSRMQAVILALLVGFSGIVNAEIALLVAGLWGVLETVHLIHKHRKQRITWKSALRSVEGPVGALLLIAIGGGVVTGILEGAPRGRLVPGLIEDPWGRQFFVRYESLQGRIGLLGLGALAAATLASFLAWRDRLVLALAAGTVPLMVAAITIRYPTAPLDVTRFDGHARNFALLALLLALASRLSLLEPRWRYGVGVILAVLVVWPTVAQPVRTLGLGMRRGITLSDPQPGVLVSDSEPWYHDLRRFVIKKPLSTSVSRFIRERTPVDARVFSPHPDEMSIVTGRPNAVGFAGHLHQEPVRSLEYHDVLHHLEPRAVGRLGYEYIHATHVWVDQLPSHSREWLMDPRLFDPLIRTEVDALYRIKPAFHSLNTPPEPASYEALRQVVSPLATVQLAPGLRPRVSLKLAMALSHARLVGALDPVGAHLLTPLPATETLDTPNRDFVVIPARMAPSAFDVANRRPVWWNDEVAVYATSGGPDPLMRPPRRDFSIELSDIRVADRRIAFTATFTDRATDRWQGQDWVVVATDDSRWRLPYRFETVEYTSVFVRWFDGQVVPVPETDTHEYVFLYEFEPHTGALALWDGSRYSSLSSPQTQLAPGAWMLAARPNVNREEVGLIPVLHFTVTDDGGLTFKAYEGSLDTMLVR